jgi:hypothetical protein
VKQRVFGVMDEEFETTVKASPIAHAIEIIRNAVVAELADGRVNVPLEEN